MKERNLDGSGEGLLSGRVRATISTRAYEGFLSCGGRQGRDMEDWLEDEGEFVDSQNKQILVEHRFR